MLVSIDIILNQYGLSKEFRSDSSISKKNENFKWHFNMFINYIKNIAFKTKKYYTGQEVNMPIISQFYGIVISMFF